MALRWKLFGLANYLLLLVYIFLCWMGFRFMAKTDILRFMPFMACLVVVLLNSIFNLYLFHKHLPDKPISRRMRKIHLISSILYTISIAIISFSLVRDIIDELRSGPINDFVYFGLSILFLTMALGLFILASQFVIGKFVEKNHSDSLNSLINDIGSKSA